MYINKIYPHNWNEINEREKQKKEQEFSIARFFLDEPSVKSQFQGRGNLCVEFHEGPDFLVYSEENLSDIIGLEITKCYVKDVGCSPSVMSNLRKICNEVVGDLQKSENSFYNINYIDVTFAHEIMIGEWYDKKVIKSELKDAVLKENKVEKKYIIQAEIGNSIIYPQDSLTIDINSNMAYLVPSIDMIVSMHAKVGSKDFDPVMQSISEKEGKLVSYKQKKQTDISQWWLCIEIPKDANINPSLYQLPADFKSDYDRIYLTSLFFYGYGNRLIFKKSIL